jgi:hypothetical protein
MTTKTKTTKTARKTASKKSVASARGFADTARITVKGELPYRADSRYGRAAAMAAKAGTVEKYRAAFAKASKMGVCTPGEVLRDASEKGYLKIA